MKKLVALAMSLTMAFSLVACGNSDASANAGTDTTATSAAATTTEAAQQTAPAEKQDVTLRMWGAEEDQPMLQGMIDSFKEHYADYANFDIQLGTESESTAKDTVLTDIEAAADVYSFASDQLIDQLWKLTLARAQLMSRVQTLPVLQTQQPRTAHCMHSL